MPRFDAFCGPWNTPASANIQSEVTINWIPERNAVSVNDLGTDLTDKNIRCALMRTPGIQTYLELPKVPVRGVFPGEFRLFAVGGDSFYEIFDGATWVDRSVPGFSGASGVGPQGGTIGNDNRPAQCFFNGTQALIISAGAAYCDIGNGPVPCHFSDTIYDLLVDPDDSTGKTVNIPNGGAFDASDVGKTLQIIEGAGFNMITQVIQEVDVDGGAIGLSAWGLPGAGQGIGVLHLGSIAYDDLHLVSQYIVHSASRVFGPSEIGTTLTITGGIGFNYGSYLITGLVYDEDGNPTGDAIVAESAGTEGSVDGVGSLESMMVTASQGAFLDGYFFVVPYPRSKTVYYSAHNDGRGWDPLDFFTKENYPDNVQSLFSDHQELYTLGNLESSQVFRNTGNADNPFQPDPGAAMHIGCQAEFSVVRLGHGVAWLGMDVRRGSRTAYHSVAYKPVAVSTPGVEAQWATYADISDAVAYTETIAGHECWVINFPTGNATWVYDVVTGWWHMRGYWNGDTSWWDMSRVWVHCVCGLGGGEEKHYGGDWENGRIYIVSMDYKTDDNWPMVRRRLAPHLTNENQRRFYGRFEIDCDVLGLQRIFWNRLGAGRDRIWMMDAIQASEAGGVELILKFSDTRGQSSHAMESQTLDPSVDVRLANAYLKWVDATWH